jgi:hypothetical protein
VNGVGPPPPSNAGGGVPPDNDDSVYHVGPTNNEDSVNGVVLPSNKSGMLTNNGGKK